MSRPTLGVEIDFANGPSFGYPFLLNDPNFGILDQNILADQAADILDVTDKVRRVSTRRGRNRILSQFEAGSATVTLNDPDSWFNPQNSSPTNPLWDPVTNSSKAVPLRKIRIYADQDRGDGFIQRFFIFSGYITSYDTSFYQGTTQDSTVTLQCADGFRLLANVATGATPLPFPQELSGARINQLLDFATWPSSLRNIDVGDSVMQADPGGDRSILAAIQTIEQSEFGAFFIQPTGVARFLDRTDVSELADVLPRVFSDTGVGLPYVNVDIAYDDQLILNDITVTKVGGGVPGFAYSQDSVDKYFVKSGQRSNLLVTNDQETQDQANMLLVARENADLRVDSMTLSLNTDNNNLNVAGLTTDIYRLIFVYKSMPGGSTIEKELFVQGVQHDITPTTWFTKFFTQEPIIQAFILNSDTQGVLDQNALTY